MLIGGSWLNHSKNIKRRSEVQTVVYFYLFLRSDLVDFTPREFRAMGGRAGLQSAFIHHSDITVLYTATVTLARISPIAPHILPLLRYGLLFNVGVVIKVILTFVSFANNLIS